MKNCRAANIKEGTKPALLHYVKQLKCCGGSANSHQMEQMQQMQHNLRRTLAHSRANKQLTFNGMQGGSERAAAGLLVRD